jgi:CRISPR-associated protein Cmr6
VAKRAGSNIDLSDVIKALTQALEWIGAGAKTAAGYGRFSESKEAKQQREREMRKKAAAEQQRKEEAKQEAKRQNMSPLEAELDRWITSNPEPNTVSAWLERMEQMDKQKDKLCIAHVMKVYYEKRGTWKKPSKKQKANVQKIKATLAS